MCSCVHLTCSLRRNLLNFYTDFGLMELDGYFAILIKASRSFDALNQNVLQFVVETSNSLRFIYIIDFEELNLHWD